MHEEPPVVGLEEILEDEQEADGRVTGTQWLLVLVGGVVGVVGLLAMLVVVAPVILQVTDAVVDTIQIFTDTGLPDR